MPSQGSTTNRTRGSLRGPVHFILALGLATFAGGASGQTVCAPDETNPTVRFETNLGDIDVELCANEANGNLDATVANFLQYVTDDAYTSTGFVHRSVNEGIHVIQGGGAYIDGGGLMQFVETRPPVALPNPPPVIDNLRGTIAMARAASLDSATSQWFINVQDNPGLDAGQSGSSNERFVVFGEVTAGLDVVDDIAAQEIWRLNNGFLAETPLIDFPNDGSPIAPFLVTISDVYVVPEPAAALQTIAVVSVLAGLTRARRRAR